MISELKIGKEGHETKVSNMRRRTTKRKKKLSNM
jgi:hypothetical protein